MKSLEMQQHARNVLSDMKKDSFKTFEPQNKSPLEDVLIHIIFNVREAG